MQVDPTTPDWQTIDKISLHCNPATSCEDAKVIVQGHKLHDIIKVDKHKLKDGTTRFSVETGPLPLSLTSAYYVRQRLMNDILPEFRRRVSVCCRGFVLF